MTTNLDIPRIEQHVRRKVLWPLGIAIAGSLAFFLFVSNYYMHLNLARTQEQMLQSLVSRYHGYIQERTGLMRTILQQLGRDPALIKALADRDRDRLLKQSIPLFNELLTEQHITHFYYHTPEGINLLRVHKPDQHSDRIDRITLHLAQRGTTTTDGLELGPLGTFTLRVVMPVHEQSRLVGYLELGEDIDPVLDNLAAEIDSHMAVLIKKTYLDQTAWRQGRIMLGEPAEWDLLPDHVLAGFTDAGLMKLLPHIATSDTLNVAETIEVTLNKRVQQGRFLNLLDAGGRSVGSLLVLQDVHDIFQEHRTSILLISSFCFLLAAFLFWIAATVLGRADRNLKLISDQLAETLAVNDKARPS